MSSHSDLGIKFYMQSVNNKGEATSDTIKDIEADFDGLIYMSVDGLEQFGSLKSYTETYADSDRVRVYLPKSGERSSFDVTLKLLFVGDNRWSSYYSFIDYITDGFHAFWDTVRKRKLIFYVDKSIEPSEISNKGSVKYIEVKIPLTSVFGRTFPIE